MCINLIVAPFGDYFRILADGEYSVKATVVIEGKKYERYACVTVDNPVLLRTEGKPVKRIGSPKQANVVNFDFTDLEGSEGTGCDQVWWLLSDLKIIQFYKGNFQLI